MTQPTLSSVPAEKTVPADAIQISVVVPVYKVEKFVAECLESILAQDFDSFEVVAVDDGSPDASGKICDEFAARDSRMRVFHKENGGVTSARRLGVERSRGEWICFVDSDDVLLPHALSALFAATKDFPDADLVEGADVSFDENEKLSDTTHVAIPANGSADEKPFSVSGLEYAREVALQRIPTTIFRPALWRKIIRRHVLLKTDALTLPSEIIWCEDTVSDLLIATGTQRAVRIPKVVYGYRRNPNSVLRSSRSRAIFLTAEYCSLLFETARSRLEKYGAEWSEIFLIFLARRFPFMARNARGPFLRHPKMCPFITALDSAKNRELVASRKLSAALAGTRFPFSLLPESLFRAGLNFFAKRNAAAQRKQSRR